MISCELCEALPASFWTEQVYLPECFNSSRSIERIDESSNCLIRMFESDKVGKICCCSFIDSSVIKRFVCCNATLWSPSCIMDWLSTTITYSDFWLAVECTPGENLSANCCRWSWFKELALRKAIASELDNWFLLLLLCSIIWLSLSQTKETGCCPSRIEQMSWTFMPTSASVGNSKGANLGALMSLSSKLCLLDTSPLPVSSFSSSCCKLSACCCSSALLFWLILISLHS